MLDFPFPDGLSLRQNSFWYAKSCEAIADRGTDLDLRNLPIEVSRRETLTEQSYKYIH